jgi:ADP-ribose pyrophosphatase
VTGQPISTVWQGKYISVKYEGTWEYVSRVRNVDAAVILALDDGHIIFVEQYRVPLKCRSLELPAGLVGDETAGEASEIAAARELEEETGYRAGKMTNLGRYYSSPGMVTEGFTLYRAEGLEKVAEGGGVDGEDIQTWRVPLADVAAFIQSRRDVGVGVDVRLLMVLAMVGAPGFII